VFVRPLGQCHFRKNSAGKTDFWLHLLVFCCSRNYQMFTTKTVKMAVFARFLQNTAQNSQFSTLSMTILLH